MKRPKTSQEAFSGAKICGGKAMKKNSVFLTLSLGDPSLRFAFLLHHDNFYPHMAQHVRTTQPQNLTSQLEKNSPLKPGIYKHRKQKKAKSKRLSPEDRAAWQLPLRPLGVYVILSSQIALIWPSAESFESVKWPF